MIHGTAYYGEVGRIDGEYLVTRFFHVWGLPLVPLRSIWVTHEQGTERFGHACRLSGRSVVAAYARTWSLVAWPLALASAPLVVIGVVGFAVMLWAERWRRVRDAGSQREAREQRALVGTACAPERWPQAMREELGPKIAERVAADVADPYRTSPLPSPPLAPLVHAAQMPAAWIGGGHESILLVPMALMALVVIAPGSHCLCESDRIVIARSQAKKLAGNYYPQWAIRGTGTCPSIEDLAELGNVKDPWGHDFRLSCGCGPSEVIMVWSIGENGIDEGGEGDDISSWR